MQVLFALLNVLQARQMRGMRVCTCGCVGACLSFICAYVYTVLCLYLCLFAYVLRLYFVSISVHELLSVSSRVFIYSCVCIFVCVCADVVKVLGCQEMIAFI